MADQKASAAELERDDGRGFHRSVGLLSAAAINMTQMVGIGPFITIPLMSPRSPVRRRSLAG
jgi:hypothetical protein